MMAEVFDAGGILVLIYLEILYRLSTFTFIAPRRDGISGSRAARIQTFYTAFS